MILGASLGQNGGSIPPVGAALANKVPTASFLMFLAIQENSGRTATIGGVAADCKSVPSW